jgi:hypothetical protein
MTFPNFDLQSLPVVLDTRVGTDGVERALQLSYYQIFAALQVINSINTNSMYPEKVTENDLTASFDTIIDNLQTDLTNVFVHYDEIWALGA